MTTDEDAETKSSGMSWRTSSFSAVFFPDIELLYASESWRNDVHASTMELGFVGEYTKYITIFFSESADALRPWHNNSMRSASAELMRGKICPGVTEILSTS